MALMLDYHKLLVFLICAEVFFFIFFLFLFNLFDFSFFFILVLVGNGGGDERGRLKCLCGSGWEGRQEGRGVASVGAAGTR